MSLRGMLGDLCMDGFFRAACSVVEETPLEHCRPGKLLEIARALGEQATCHRDI